MRMAFNRWIMSLLVVLAGCSSPEQQREAQIQDPATGEVYTRQRVVVSDLPQRGRVLDRYDSVLVATRPQYLLKLPRRPPLDTLALSELLGWDSLTVRQRIADALPYEEAPAGYPVQLRLTAAEGRRVRRDSSNWPNLTLVRWRQRTYTTGRGSTGARISIWRGAAFPSPGPAHRARALLPAAQWRGRNLLQRPAEWTPRLPASATGCAGPGARQLGDGYRLSARPGPAPDHRCEATSLRRKAAGRPQGLPGGPGPAHRRNSVLRVGARLHRRLPSRRPIRPVCAPGCWNTKTYRC